MTADELLQKLKAIHGKAKHGGSGWIYIPCPTCTTKDRKKNKRCVSNSNMFSKCWICQVPMLVSDLIHDVGFVATVSEPGDDVIDEENPLARVMPGSRFIPVNELDNDHPAVKFLYKDYLFDLNDYAERGIVYCPADGGMILRGSNPFISTAERLIFPVQFKKEMVGWQSRSLPGTVYGDRKDCLKYYHLFPKGKYLYNYDQAKEYEIVILVEGVKKALKLPNAVASWGNCVSYAQIQLLLEWKNIVVMLDGDDDSQVMARKLAAGLQENRNVININLGEYNIPSPDEATQEQLLEIVTTKCRALK